MIDNSVAVTYETLEKQPQLLSERSQDKNLAALELCEITNAMVKLAYVIVNP